MVGTGIARKGGLLWRIGRAIEDFTYRNADKIIVISEDFKRNIMAKGVPEEKRTARFRCCMALVYPSSLKDAPADLVAAGAWEGRIACAPSGENGFGYDPLFLDPELGRTAAELSREEKMARSHRGRALARLLEELEKRRG